MAAAKAASVSKVEDSSSSESDRRLITLLVALPCSLLAAMMLSSVELLFEIILYQGQKSTPSLASQRSSFLGWHCQKSNDRFSQSLSSKSGTSSSLGQK